jgi:hypothetical protein
MSEPTLMLVAAAVIILALVVILWRLVGALQETTGQRLRSSDRERRDLFQMLERSLERRDTPTHQHMDTMDRHRTERINQVNADAIVEKAATKKNEPPTPSKIYDGGRVAAEIGASFK